MRLVDIEDAIILHYHNFVNVNVTKVGKIAFWIVILHLSFCWFWLKNFVSNWWRIPLQSIAVLQSSASKPHPTPFGNPELLQAGNEKILLEHEKGQRDSVSQPWSPKNVRFFFSKIRQAQTSQDATCRSLPRKSSISYREKTKICSFPLDILLVSYYFLCESSFEKLVQAIQKSRIVFKV